MTKEETVIIRIENIKDVCSTILPAVDSTKFLSITETLQLEAENGILTMSVTNREYFVKVKLDVDKEEKFVATVNANLFLQLVSHTTSETVELSVDETNLTFKGNGTYKIPLIYDGSELLKLPEIVINNVTSSFSIESSILHDILKYNSKQITIGTLSRPVQKMYYVDEKGCITFTSGACVNNFTLEKPVKLLFNDRLVKLFKLFKSPKVTFTLGFDEVSDDIIQTKVMFDGDNVTITSILSCDDSLITSVPADAIRKRATNTYPYSIVINKNELMETICRLLLFADDKSTRVYSTFEFTPDCVTIWDTEKNNNEEIMYENHIDTIDSYSAILDFFDLKAVLDTCSEQYINLSFGDGQAVVISRKNIYNVIPECKVIS